MVSLATPAGDCDPLTDLLRAGARRLIEAAVSAEFEEYLSSFNAEYRLRILKEADRCTRPGEVGRLLRREGLYTSCITCASSSDLSFSK